MNDHSKQAGTDADVAIAYYNTEDKLCLWLIEHKLSEREFTECGAYKSKANKMLAFALQETGTYNRVTFSVCHHGKNTMLDKSINQYKALTNEDRMFSSFTNYDVLNAVNVHDSELQKWLQWYKELYCF